VSTILVVANETLGGRPLIDAVRARAAKGDARFVLCVPQTRPRAGLVVYDDAVFDAAQARVDLALGFIRSEEIEAVGEVGDPDPYTATMDAIHEYKPQEIIISTYPATRSGWLRRDLIERVAEASGLPVKHVVADIENDGLEFKVTLVVANRTASSDELLEALKAKAQTKEHGEAGRLYLVIVPQERGDAAASRRGRKRLALVIDRLRNAGLFASGMTGDPDPYTATINALQSFRVDDIVISTLAVTKSGWLRADLVERVRNASGKEVEHIVQRDPATASA
jgi:hypothetical protein